MGCDLCGNEGPMFQVRIEGTVMTVCSSCKGYGEVIRRLPTQREERQEERRARRQEEAGGFAGPVARETMLLVMEGYGPVIRKARERLGLKQEDLAKILHLKESQLHTYESGGRKPDLETARLLEKALKIRLVEEHVEEHGKTAGKRASGPLTIGDLLKK